MRRTHLIGGVLALAAIVFVVQWSVRAARESAAVLPASSTPAAARTIERSDFEFAEPAEPETTTVVEVATIDAPERVALTPVAKRGTRTISGTVTVLDPDGLVSAVDGQFYLGFYGGARLHTHSVSFSNGIWSAQVEVLELWSELEIRVPKVRGFHASVEEPKGRIAFPIEGELAIVLRAPRRNVLLVIDAESGAHLSLVCVMKSYFTTSDHPGADTTCTDSPTASPIDFETRPSLLSSARLHVGAAGYAWRNVQLDLAAGGERYVALERGADLTVIVPREELGQARWLRLYMRDIALTPRDKIPASGVVEYRGLPAATVRVALESELQVVYVPTRAIAEAEVTLVAGSKTRLEFTTAHRLPELPDEKLPKSELLVRVVPGIDGVVPTSLRWMPRTTGKSGVRGTLEAQWEPVRAAYVIEAEPDYIWLGAFGPTGLLAEEEVFLTQLAQEHTLRVGPPIGIALTLHDGVVQLPIDARVAAAVELQSTGTGREIWRRPKETILSISVTEPGRYTLQLPKLPGYRAVKPLRVSVSGKGLEEVRVLLEREHP